MSFREKSTWVMTAVMLLSGLFYMMSALPYPGSPVMETVVPYVLLVIVLSVAGQVVLAIRSPDEARAPLDERERLVVDRAGYWGGVILAAAIVLAGIAYVVAPNGNMLFHHAVLALIVAQIAQYIMQIALLRRAL